MSMYNNQIHVGPPPDIGGQELEVPESEREKRERVVNFICRGPDIQRLKKLIKQKETKKSHQQRFQHRTLTSSASFPF